MLRINVARYKQEIARVEKELRATKVKMAQSGYQSGFDWSSYYRLKAEATRLYLLRTEFRAHPHPITGGWYLRKLSWMEKPHTVPIPSAPQYRMTRLQISKAVLEGELNWELPFIEDYTPPAPPEVVPAPAVKTAKTA